MNQIRVLLSEEAHRTIQNLRLAGETNAETADRLLANLLPIAPNPANYAEHFGKQRRRLESKQPTRKQWRRIDAREPAPVHVAISD